METGFVNHNSPETSGGDSPRSAVSAEIKIASTSSSKRSRRAVQKRAVLVPIVKGDQMKAPPSDSWAWRKYGQKPIKGSPYPRGYYRCSSSKGCPARKQVERSRVDPKMLVVTYYCEHNHNWPEFKSTHHRPTASTAAVASRSVKASVSSSEEEEEEEEEDNEEEEEEDEVEEERPRVLLTNQLEERAAEENEISTNLGEAPPVHSAEFGWFADFESTSFTTLEIESPMMLIEDRISTDTEMAMIFAMREEDESLFAGLGELPECSTVFGRGMVGREAEQRWPGLATTG